MKKTLIFSAVIIVLLCAAIFGRKWLEAQKIPPQTHAADEFESIIYDSLSAMQGDEELAFFEITAENAANAIRQIKKNQKYCATYTVERISGAKSLRTENTVWADGEKYRVEISGDTEKTVICDGERVKIINHDRDTSSVVAQGEEFTLNSQTGVVGLEYFLDNAENELITANYAETAGRISGNIIYVEFYYPKFNQLEQFYISADHGAVLAAQTLVDDVVTYRLSTQQFVEEYSSDGTMFDILD